MQLNTSQINERPFSSWRPKSMAGREHNGSNRWKRKRIYLNDIGDKIGQGLVHFDAVLILANAISQRLHAVRDALDVATHNLKSQ